MPAPTHPRNGAHSSSSSRFFTIYMSEPSPQSRRTPSSTGRSPRTPANGASRSSDALPSDFPNKHPNTFTSCLSIPVEGAIPIMSQDDPPSVTLSRMSDHSASSSKRAPRKSKTHALAALHYHASSHDNDDVASQDISDDFSGDPTPISISPSLDLSSVKTSSPRNQPPRASPRPFGLEDCPVFYPNSDEFKDPMSYIRSISEKALNYGICKVVPPVGWKMPFVTDTEVCVILPHFSHFLKTHLDLIYFHFRQSFRFKTRLQRLNSIEASSRAKVNFLEQLYRFHKQQGNPRVSVPTINHKSLDLWLLRKEVHKLGGYDAVCIVSCHIFFPTANLYDRSQRIGNGVTLALSSATGAYRVYPLRSRIPTRESFYHMSTFAIECGIHPHCPLHPVALVILTSKLTQIFKRREPVMDTIAMPHPPLLVL